MLRGGEPPLLGTGRSRRSARAPLRARLPPSVCRRHLALQWPAVSVCAHPPNPVLGARAGVCVCLSDRSDAVVPRRVVCARGCTEPEWVRAQPERAPRGARELMLYQMRVSSLSCFLHRHV